MTVLGGIVDRREVDSKIVQVTDKDGYSLRLPGGLVVPCIYAETAIRAFLPHSRTVN